MRTYVFFMTAALAAAQSPVFMNMSTQMDADSVTITFGAPRFMGLNKTGAPYSAEQTQEHVQTLADGTHIRQPANVQRFYRDSQGRTRTERPLLGGMMMMAAGGPRSDAKLMIVEIADPVAGVAYVLDDQNKIAHRSALPAPPPRRMPMAPPVSGANAPARPDIKREDLGEQNIEGVLAHGSRTTTTWPVDSQGNDRPLVDTNEMWLSQELGVTVLMKSNSARGGESTTRLTNISRAEPDPALFQPPAGYTVVDEKDSFKMTLARH